jgi:spermidine/putrescine transport system permease protein
MNSPQSNILRFFTLAVLVFLYLPIVITIVYSFNSAPSGFRFESFTFKWYKDLFHDTNILLAMKTTFLIGIFSSIISTIIGILGAYCIYNARIRKQNLLLFINNIPIINPDLITGVSLLIFFVFLKIQLGFTTLLISHIVFSIPYAVLIIYPKMKTISIFCIEAAYDLGATQFQTFYKIILPEIKSAIVSATLICFTLSLDDFIVSFFTTGNDVNNLSILVYSIVRRGIRPSIGALAALMFIVIFILLFIINKKFVLTKLEDIENPKK